MSAFDKLLNQIDAFIRKYYKNELLKGLILTVGVFVGSFLFVTFLEYVGRFNSYVRGVFFFSFLILNVYIVGRYFVIPILKLYSFGRRIDRWQASKIIGSFFPQISDRLLNTLQLNEESNDRNYELIRASVVQKSNGLSVFTFSDAIDLRQNKRYIKYVAPLFLLLLGIAVFLPGMLKQGTERVVNFNKEFVPQAPFQFVLLNNKLTAEEGEDLPIGLKLTGDGLPSKVYLVSDQGKFLMNWDTKNRASYSLSKIQNNTSFHFEGNSFSSQEYTITVDPKTSIGKMEAKVEYPAYLGMTAETIQNASDLTLPEGSIVEWSFLTKNARQVTIEDEKETKVFNEDGFKYKKKAYRSGVFSVKLENRSSGKLDSTKVNLKVIQDAYPLVTVTEEIDSLKKGLRFFTGAISDDYGLTGLRFVYKITSEGNAVREESLNVFSPKGNAQPFTFAVDFTRENLKVNDRIDYYFIVTDNDGVNGRKSSRSQSFSYKLPSLSELNESRDEAQEATKSSLNDILKKSELFKKDVDRLKKDINNSKSNDWKQKNELQRLQNEQMNLQKQVDQLQKQMQQSSQEKDQLSQTDPAILEKEKMIEELLKELMDDEMLELLKKLEELLDKQNPDEMRNEMDNLQQNAEDRNKQLDRSMEMLKKLQVNEKIDDIEKELNALAKEQEKLKKDIEDNKLNSEEAKKKQDELNKQFEEIKKDIEEMKDLNKNLERPMDIGDQKELKDKIDAEMKEASESLEKSKQKKAGEKQQDASEDLNKMAEELNAMQEEANAEQQGEDIESLRRILKNLMTLSFDQEMVMNRFEKVKDEDPAYKKYGRKQRSIVDETKQVKDSLEALAKRQPKIAGFVDKELNEIKSNHALALEGIDEHQRKELTQHQQFVMTSYNNLALLLNEALESMQKQMQNMKPGSGSCDKPGSKGRPKPGEGLGSMDMKQMLKKQLEQMQKGPNPGGTKPGDKPGSGNSPGGMKPGEQGQGMPGLGNKETAKMAAEQTAIRQKLEQLRNELNKEGQGKGNQLNPLIKELEQQERDLINKNFSPDMIRRQKDILTRLLESEKALLERGYEDKRESKDGKDRNNGNIIQFDEYNKEKLRQIELMRSVDPVFKQYYKDKANAYFNRAI